MNKDFCERLIKLRKESGLLQKDLAEKLNTSTRRISHIERGDIEPDLYTLIEISNIFDVSTDYLLGKTDY